MKKVIFYGIIVLIVFIISPILGLIVITSILIYKLIKSKNKKNEKSVSKIKEFILGIISKKYEKITLLEKIEIYKTKNDIKIMRKGFNWSIIICLSLYIPNDVNIDIKRLSEIAYELNFAFVICNPNQAKLIIRENVFSLKLNKNVLKSKIYSLAGKARFLVGYFENLNCKVDWDEGLIDEVQLI